MFKYFRTGYLLKFAVLIVVSTGLVVSGCGQGITSYLVEEHNPAAVKTILVLPFLDTRTFRAENDVLGKDAAQKGREIFIDSLRSQSALARKTVIAPVLESRQKSYSLMEIISLGEKFNSDLVVAGQIFSFTGTRAASIPPRSGMFVRIYSVAEKRLVFAGDDYRAAGVPGASGGRLHQARIVADTLVSSYLAAKTTQGRTLMLKKIKTGLPKVLILPYHERENPMNIIAATGGGAVTTAIYVMELGWLGRVEVFESADKNATYSHLLSVKDALVLAKESGADYVVRGQVVEFRRSQSVPSLWSAVISISILAAQVMFAEVSGVDIASEIYQVSDGSCIYAKRDLAHQKYVVKAERTVRRLAVFNAKFMLDAILAKNKAKVMPIIDSIKIPETEVEIKTAAVKLAGKERKKTAKKTSRKAGKKED